MIYPKPSSSILIYRDTVVPLSFGGTWWQRRCKLCRKLCWIVQKMPIESCTIKPTHPPHTIPTVLHISTSMIPTYFNPFPPFCERPASSIEQSAHRIVLPVLSKSAPSSVLYISTSMLQTYLFLLLTANLTHEIRINTYSFIEDSTELSHLMAHNWVENKSHQHHNK